MKDAPVGSVRWNLGLLGTTVASGVIVVLPVWWAVCAWWDVEAWGKQVAVRVRRDWRAWSASR